MRKYLLPKEGIFYKANLHCHSTCSDGCMTPEELKEWYKSAGYSILAFTDHDIMLPHNELNDESFLTLNGFEMEIYEPKNVDFFHLKTCHICFIALDPDNLFQPMWNKNYLFGNAPKHIDEVRFDESKPPYERKYSSEGISEIMRNGRDAGFFVTYNHPSWSRENYPEYMGYKGMHAFEMFNGSCLVQGYEDYNPRVYDDLLKNGKIFCIGSDDNHNVMEKGKRNFDSGIAFTVIKADSLDYKQITDALINGSFYASEGPQITELYIEDDGRIHVECSEADRIIYTPLHRYSNAVLDETGSGITSADFFYKPNHGYFRITIIDKAGRHACTNAYFPEDLI